MSDHSSTKKIDMKQIFVAVLASITFSSITLAADTGWVSGAEFLKISRKLAKQDMLITRLECKDSGKLGLSWKAGLARAFYEPNTKNIRWAWKADTNVVAYKKKKKRDGYKLVSDDSFVRKNSGLKIYCPLYHK